MDDRLWGASLNVCAIAGEPGVAMLVLETMQEEEYRINVVHCTSYLKAASVAGFDTEAIQFLDHMAGLSENNFDCAVDVPPPDRIAVQTVLTACSNTGNFAAARLILDNLKHRRYGDHIQLSTFDCFICLPRSAGSALSLIHI